MDRRSHHVEAAGRKDRPREDHTLLRLRHEGVDSRPWAADLVGESGTRCEEGDHKDRHNGAVVSDVDSRSRHRGPVNSREDHRGSRDTHRLAGDTGPLARHEAENESEDGGSHGCREPQAGAVSIGLAALNSVRVEEETDIGIATDCGSFKVITIKLLGGGLQVSSSLEFDEAAKTISIARRLPAVELTLARLYPAKFPSKPRQGPICGRSPSDPAVP